MELNEDIRSTFDEAFFQLNRIEQLMSSRHGDHHSWHEVQTVYKGFPLWSVCHLPLCWNNLR